MTQEIADFFLGVGENLQQIGPKADKSTKTSVFLECGPMQWASGDMKGQIYGPFKNAEEAHNYVAVKQDRNRLSNAKYHGETGSKPMDDKTYMGHPMFQYRIMGAPEYFNRYFAQIIDTCLHGMNFLTNDQEPEVFWPNKAEEPAVGLLDSDEWEEDENE